MAENPIESILTGANNRRYIRGLSLIASVGSEFRYYLHDAHGNVVALTDSSGSITRTYEYDAFGNQLNIDPTDTNPFRYCGEYWDAETGSYYLRARYYDSAVGRFLTEDAWSGIITAPSTLNAYVYCGNNPVHYVDSSGHFWETAFDIGSLIWSATDMAKNPSWANLGTLLWDVGATIVPFVPGSSLAKGGRLLVKNSDRINDVVSAFHTLSKAERIDAFKDGGVIMPYRALKKLIKGSGLEAHHLIEKRFAATLDITDANAMLSIAIDKDKHRTITNLMRKKIPYDSIFKGADELTTSTANAQDIWNALCETYTHEDVNLPEYITLLKSEFLSAGFDLDWEAWIK